MDGAKKDINFESYDTIIFCNDEDFLCIIAFIKIVECDDS